METLSSGFLGSAGELVNGRMQVLSRSVLESDSRHKVRGKQEGKTVGCKIFVKELCMAGHHTSKVHVSLQD